MGVNKKTDGRYIVGMGAPNENEYKGSQGWRDIFIQLTETGATPDSEEKLAFLRDYAIYHNGEGNAIMPPSVSVWVSNNGVTSAVNADDITLEDGTYTICGIKWDGSSWDYTNAGQSSGGGGSSLPSYTPSDVGKVLTVEAPTETITIAAEQSFMVENGYGQMTVDFTPLSVGDHAQVESAVSGQTVSIDMVVVEHDGELYLIDALYSEYDPTHGYVSEDGVFYYPAMAQVPSVELSGSITTVKTTGPELLWEGMPRVVYDELDGQVMKTLTVSKAAELYSKGYIIYTHGLNGNIKLLTNITAASTSGYNIYYDFNSTAEFTNVNGDGKVPVIQVI